MASLTLCHIKDDSLLNTIYLMNDQFTSQEFLAAFRQHYDDEYIAELAITRGHSITRWRTLHSRIAKRLAQEFEQDRRIIRRVRRVMGLNILWRYSTSMRWQRL